VYTGGEIKDALLCRTVRLVNIPVTGEKPRLGCAAPLLGGVFCLSEEGMIVHGFEVYQNDEEEIVIKQDLFVQEDIIVLSKEEAKILIKEISSYIEG
jgi:hypothetical protein